MAFRPQNVVGKKLGPITSTPAKPFPKPDYRMPGPSTQIPPEMLAKKFKVVLLLQKHFEFLKVKISHFTNKF